MFQVLFLQFSNSVFDHEIPYLSGVRQEVYNSDPRLPGIKPGEVTGQAPLTKQVAGRHV